MNTEIMGWNQDDSLLVGIYYISCMGSLWMQQNGAQVPRYANVFILIHHRYTSMTTNQLTNAHCHRL